jgi:methionyl-tRNA synthetase
MLKAEGSYILPDNVPANEFLNLEGRKLSTSKNWAVWLHNYLEDFPGKEDVLRYVLTANAPETKDNDFTWKDFQTRNNSELVAIYGNFINRVVVLTHKYYKGVVPKASEFSETDLKVFEDIKTFPSQISASIEKYRFREAQAIMMNLARLGNKYLADEEPWKLQKTNPERTSTIMYVALQVSSALAVLSEPFLPFTASKLKTMLNFEGFSYPFWNDISKLDELLPSTHNINSAEFLFSKIEEEEIQKQVDKLEASKIENEEKEVEPQKEVATFEDFSKLDLRVGTIITAEKKAKTKKLMVLTVDTGLDERTIVSGIAEHYKPEELIGRKVSVVVNLKPITLKGTLSEGMILMTEDSSGKLTFVNPDPPGEVENGSTIN